MLRTQKIITALRNLLRKKNMYPSQTKTNCYMLLQEGPGGERKKKTKKKTLAFRCAGRLSHKQGA